jgi:hypothetical protein
MNFPLVPAELLEGKMCHYLLERTLGAAPELLWKIWTIEKHHTLSEIKPCFAKPVAIIPQ